MRVLALLLRVYSYLFHLALTLFLGGIAAMALLAGVHNIHLDMLPWTGKTLTWWLLGGSLAGLMALALAVAGVFRYLLPVWSGVVVTMMVRGYFLSGYKFEGADDFHRTLYLTAGAVLALAGSVMKPAGGKRRKRWPLPIGRGSVTC